MASVDKIFCQTAGIFFKKKKSKFVLKQMKDPLLPEYKCYSFHYKNHVI